MRVRGLHLVVLLLAWAGFVAAVYCPDIGRGFVKDDFTWIRSARADADRPSALVLPGEPGFYRPLVTASFLADYDLHGWTPRGYGWTNLALYGLCALGVGLLAVALGLPTESAVAAAFLWAVNPHGINMAVVWLSGRTALLLTLFATTAAAAFLRRRYVVASVLIACALASKEEAVLLPALLLAWRWTLDRRVDRGAVAAALVPLVLYFGARSVTPAFTPATAPSFYQFTVAPAHVVRNLAEYLDRSATIAAIAVVLGALVYRARPALQEGDGRLLAMCGVWWAAMFGLTLWLPVRSSLYAVCPSVASAVAAGLLLARFPRPARAWRAEYLLAGVLVASIPIYQVRNDPWVEGARVSERTLETVRRDAAALPPTGTVVLRDEAGTVSSFHNAFGDLATEALRTAVGRRWSAEVVDPPAGETPLDVIAVYQLEHGRIVRLDASD